MTLTRCGALQSGKILLLPYNVNEEYIQDTREDKSPCRMNQSDKSFTLMLDCTLYFNAHKSLPRCIPNFLSARLMSLLAWDLGGCETLEGVT